MIRTVQQWLTSPEHDALAKGGALAAFIEAVQRDGYEAGFTDAREAAAEACARRSNFTARVDVDLIMAACVNDIRALIPTAPGTPRPGEPSKTPGRRT